METYKNVWAAINDYCYARKELQELHDHLMNARILLEDTDMGNWFDDMHFGEVGAHISIEQNEEKAFGLLEGLQ
tara:strand:+ start:2157 stop:2378 length:222 start_codon:yes stop_codon:yes gene_type:complete